MAVYTEVTEPQLRDFLANYGLGEGFTFSGIKQGVENTNYLIVAADGSRYVLTIFERRVNRTELPFFLSLVGHLAANGFPCPMPLTDKNGEQLATLAGKPACLVDFLFGEQVATPTVEHCRAVGEALGKLHGGGKDFGEKRENDMGVGHFDRLYRRFLEYGGGEQPGLAAEIAELARLVQKLRLPSGIIHGDLFPDNVFFKDGKLNGVIDFYFAATDILAYDVAITINAWCFRRRDGTMHFESPKAAAIIDGYRRCGEFSKREERALPLLLRAAAMRFFLTRLIDSVRPGGGEVQAKDPQDFAAILAFHRGNRQSGIATE